MPAWLAPLAPSPLVLGAAVALDLAIGDPTYPAHPIRLIGATITAVERGLRRVGADGYAGGVCLAIGVAAIWVALWSAAVLGAARGPAWLAFVVHAFVVYSLMALGDLLRHVWRVERALGADDLDGARAAVGALVVRDADRLDAAACRRAAIESLAENLTDGFTSAVCWYAVGGVPGLVLFKVASTLDSMVGNRTPRYLRFGWAGARLDDVMNYLPARLTWLLLAATAAAIPGCAAADALTVGLRQHAVLPGPNSGWSEAAAAGALRRRLVGPIWLRGVLVTDVWIGQPDDPPASSRSDVIRAVVLIGATGVLSALLAMAALAAA
ncbi:MAG: adenosylcobinamide-phosphate synthase CbiB [Vicinamibacteraceae bacterium]